MTQCCLFNHLLWKLLCWRGCGGGDQLSNHMFVYDDRKCWS